MRAPGKPQNEHARMRALEEYEVLDTLPEQVYDDIVGLAAHICGTPISALTLVDSDRQWFKSIRGLSATQTSRDVSFCGHVVEVGEFMEVPNAVKDERFFDNPLVTGDPRIAFYAGAPLETSDGLVMGSLCVIDQKPRELSAEQQA